MGRSGIIGAFFLITSLISCTKKSVESHNSRIPLMPFSDSFQLFIHRVNDPNEAVHLLPHYAGVEIDVYFDYAEQCFIVKHDKEEASNITLEKYFTACHNYPKAKYWIDFKNLKHIHSLAPISRLNYLDSKFKIKNRIIIESKEAEKLHNIGREGYFTSYWIITPYEEDKTDVINKVKSDLTKFQFNAISGNQDISPIFQKHFSSHVHHYWTSKNTDELISVDEARKDEQCKIVLVDDREIFQKVIVPKP